MVSVPDRGGGLACVEKQYALCGEREEEEGGKGRKLQPLNSQTFVQVGIDLVHLLVCLVLYCIKKRRQEKNIKTLRTNYYFN